MENVLSFVLLYCRFVGSKVLKKNFFLAYAHAHAPLHVEGRKWKKIEIFDGNKARDISRIPRMKMPGLKANYIFSDYIVICWNHDLSARDSFSAITPVKLLECRIMLVKNMFMRVRENSSFGALRFIFYVYIYIYISLSLSLFFILSSFLFFKYTALISRNVA